MVVFRLFKKEGFKRVEVYNEIELLFVDGWGDKYGFV